MSFLKLSLGAGLVALSFGALAQAAPAKVYIVQLADPPLATYNGTLPGLAATKPLPGNKLDLSSSAVVSYSQRLATKRMAVQSTLAKGSVLYDYSAVINGFSAKLTDAQVRQLRANPGVTSIIESVMYKLDTTRTPEFLGINTPTGLWSRTDASARAIKGENIIIGIVDSGIWPEDPSFGDKVDAAGKPVPYYGTGTSAYSAPPAKWKGVCQTGPGFTTAMCNNKLIGARFYASGFLSTGAALSPLDFLSARNGPRENPHGSHTASTAGGNSNVDVSVDGVNVGVMSGVAPRARIAAYKACWGGLTGLEDGCNSSDSVKAIDDAVKDGVDVINYSVGGTPYNFADPVQIAFLNAAAAGVFVSASAGNSGPFNTVAHPSPWLTTVAASTHDRYTVAQVNLGNGTTASGPSFQKNGVPSTPLILASNAGVKPFASLSPADQDALKRCYGADDRASLGGSADAALDPAKTAGRIVVCLRGGSNLVAKAEAVKVGNAAGMLLQNTPDSEDTVFNQSYVVPTVHLTVASYTAVTTYAAQPNATASFGPGLQAPNVVAPVMANFSSRGPSLANTDIMKPDITAPGVDVIAAWAPTLTQAEHDAVANGSLRPSSDGISISGTSMSSPHVAGIAALLKQLHPDWSPAAIKSAITTTATGVKLADGTPDLDRFGYGAGHVNPNAAADPGLVYDATASDYGRFLCGLGLVPPSGIGTCSTLGSVTARDLNMPSISGDVVGLQVYKRTVTNVSGAAATFTASATLPGWTVEVSPSTLTLAPGASGSFTVKLTATTTAVNTWTFGTLVWSNSKYRVVSPLTVRAKAFSAPSDVTDRRTAGRGTKSFQVTTNYTGSMVTKASGLVPATTFPGMLPVAPGFQQLACYNVEIPPNTEVFSARLFARDTYFVGNPATPLLNVLIAEGPNGSGAFLVATLNSLDADKNATLRSPAPGTYSACVLDYFGVAGGANYTLYTWAVAPSSLSLPMRAMGPSTVKNGGVGTVTAGWEVSAGLRYLGNISFTDPASMSLGQTTILVDTK